MPRATLARRPDDVSAMFDQAARRYDLTNTLLSAGRDRMWRARTREALALLPGERCLDVACGTGVSTEELARSGATVIGVDRSPGMVARGAGRPVGLRVADALDLPFQDGEFDAVTIMFGLRNVVDAPAALREMARVVRPGGRLVVCEFSHPLNPPFRTLYLRYLMGGLPRIARRVSSNPDAYTYLADTIRAWHDQPGLAAVIAANGWSRVSWRNLTGGIVALHRAVRPASGTPDRTPQKAAVG
ncbi:demethylmenaquinone methyltransferase [Streptomyces albus]|uniref:Demethylmenaquinone methyltransferase n=1 Tax=Streptomyces albus TaxID=1888 RepID=A0A6C1BXT1_9ACTN|nr:MULTISPECIES: demethylmenaquinone methyltransferase [Streptomyces]KPC94886.1 ubiquinone biosynthesis methyltransferase UbiE [Streptomyces sp. NRRL F-6602]QID34815.1 demethylmenaquinone methyltransferase [Streptomyces albus]TGG74711.1 demethylmenaquinone methyltransferase [Streptomyces albus]UVN58380.1 demethylmenaquinone methyltransferase [Streptomyces albus]GHJ20990.1 demethylmenaquinone methyltransferase [Streptomyces albus]